MEFGLLSINWDEIRTREKGEKSGQVHKRRKKEERQALSRFVREKKKCTAKSSF